MKKKLVVVIFIGIIAGIIYLYFNQNNGAPQNVLKDYFSKLNNQEYNEIYKKLSNKSKADITEEDFVTRNKNIYSGIDLVSIDITIDEIKYSSQKEVDISYTNKMKLSSGEISLKNVAHLVKER